MRLLVQWALSTPGAAEWVESSKWHQLPHRPDPTGGGPPLDHTKGWIHVVTMQGLIFSGDHYHVEDLAPDEVQITCWSDDPTHVDPGTRYAAVWRVKTLRPGPDGLLNTDQARIFYAEDLDAPRWKGVPSVFPWSDFTPPAGAGVRHGKGMTQDEFEAHAVARGAKVEKRGAKVVITESHGWRDFVEGVDPALVEGGRVVRRKK